MDEIVKLVIDRNKRRKVLSQNDIKRICQIIIGTYKYGEDYKVKFEAKSPFEDGTYGTASSESITFYKDALESAQEKKYADICSTDRIDGGKVDFYNFVILDCIFHEFTHVAQHDIENRGRGIDSKLFAICRKLCAIKDFYDNNYDNFITEVNAYSKGILKAYNVYSKIPSDYLTENDKSLYGSLVMDRFLEQYYIDSVGEKITSPSELLLESADDFNISKLGIDMNDFKDIVYSNNDLTIYRKLTLGLPLTYMECAYVNLLSTCVQGGQEVNFVKKLQKKL